MCTIGAILGESLLLFKNRDLTHGKPNPPPEVREGKYRYLGFGREKGIGTWAGINEKGLGLVASDAHTTKKYQSPKNASDLVFGAYEKALSEKRSASSAKKSLIEFYGGLKLPDIVLVADRKRAIVIEYSPERRRLEGIRAGFVVRTNNFIIAPGAKPREDDPDTYLRYERARALLSSDSSIGGVKALCRDHASGPSLNSICRHSEKGYNTIYSAIMQASENISAEYLANEHPCAGEYKKIVLE